MKTNNRIAFKALLIAAAALTSAAGLAGSKFTGDGHVQITRNADGTGQASGYLSVIYNMVGNNEWMGCQKSSTHAVFCHAKNLDQTLASCVATSEFLANAVSSLSPDAKLSFRFDANGRCTNISVTHSSEYEDKK